MMIFEYGLRYLLQEQRAYFLESLEVGGLDISAESWPHDIIERNAQAGAESMRMFLSHLMRRLLRHILNDKEIRLSVEVIR